MCTFIHQQGQPTKCLERVVETNCFAEKMFCPACVGSLSGNSALIQDTQSQHCALIRADLDKLLI
ncbi:unnamed protein product [Chondrus crispus]|uniref:Uncharacterized protein n=1 Tax=Chondrus crispus TaxID=2769 RepID=R7QT40_CHOCR|nr:unnamed protein product [Chondrus crispus]CDF40681.1 unnamed protein product [Chondrus crispus]|eukprot:XP_005710975.1 unnamed protein product [Chondrus crispus]